MKQDAKDSTLLFCTLVFGTAGALIGGGYYGTWNAAALGGGIGLIAIPALIVFWIVFG